MDWVRAASQALAGGLPKNAPSRERGVAIVLSHELNDGNCLDLPQHNASLALLLSISKEQGYAGVLGPIPGTPTLFNLSPLSTVKACCGLRAT